MTQILKITLFNRQKVLTEWYLNSVQPLKYSSSARQNTFSFNKTQCKSRQNNKGDDHYNKSGYLHEDN